MGFTVKEALELADLRSIRLAGGAEGVHRVINWVTIVEILEDTSRLQKGEFLITTGYGLAKNKAKRQKLLQECLSRKLSGIAIHTGFYLPEIPEDMIQFADRWTFPILEIPKEYSFSLVTKAILERIVNRQLCMLETSQKIHKQLTGLVLENKGFAPIADILRQLTAGDIRIYDDIWEKIAQSPAEAQQLIGDEQIQEAYRRLKESDRLKELTVCKKSISSLADHDRSELRITFFPIVANDFIYGYICIGKPSKDWKETDIIAVEHASTVCAIEFLKKAAVAEAEIRLKGGFLEELLGDHQKNEASLTERAKLLNLNLQLVHAVVSFKIHFTYDYFDDGEMQQIRNKLYYTIDHVIAQKNKQYLLRFGHDGVTLFAETKGETGIHAILEEINDLWRYHHPHLRLSIGVGEPTHHLHQYARSRWESEVAVKYGHLLHHPSPITHYKDLGAYHLLFEMQEKGIDLERYIRETLGSLAVTGKKENNPLLTTLDIYLLYNLSMKEAADALFIHRHTMKYRLQQIEKKTGKSLDSPHDRLQFQLAIMAYKMLYS